MTVVALSLVTAACGDPADHYFDRTREVIETMRAESIAATPPGGAITRDGVAEVNAARRSAAEALAELNPPAETRPEHLALATALGDLVAAVDAFLVDTADTDAEGFAAAAAAAADLQALAERVAAACNILARRADDLGVDADIRC